MVYTELDRPGTSDEEEDGELWRSEDCGRTKGG